MVAMEDGWSPAQMATLIGWSQSMLVAPGMWEAFGYRSQDEAIDNMIAGIERYITTPSEKWNEVLVQQTGVWKIPDEALRGRLFVGAIRFGLTVADMVPILRDPQK
jgi:hypothetical protein